MKKSVLFALWGGMFALCAGLGFVPEAAGFVKFLLVALALGFFVPPLLLLRLARRTGDRACAALVRNLALASLALTLLALVANFLSVLGSVALGNALYTALVIVSAPMVCGQYWVLSLFCWACVMITAGGTLKKIKARAA